MPAEAGRAASQDESRGSEKMSIDMNILHRPDRQGVALLAAAPPAEIAQLVLSFCDHWRAEGDDVDPERLQFAGAAVGRSRQGGIDAVILSWLDAEGSPERLLIAAWLLFGYWRHAEIVHRDAWVRLTGALDSLDRSSLTYVGTLSALYAVLVSRAPLAPDDRQWLRSFLNQRIEELKRLGMHEGLITQLTAPRPS